MNTIDFLKFFDFYSSKLSIEQVGKRFGMDYDAFPIDEEEEPRSFIYKMQDKLFYSLDFEHKYYKNDDIYHQILTEIFIELEEFEFAKLHKHHQRW